MDKVVAFNLGAVASGNKQKFDKDIEYIKEGAHPCEVTGVETSSQREDYGGAPYVMFNVKSGNKLGRAKFWAIRESDKQSTKEWKAKQLKDFLINCGIRDFSDDTNAIQQAIGSKVNIAFIYEEYVTRHRDTDEPLIRKAIRYRWSSKDGAKISYREDMNQPLSKESMEQYTLSKSEWETSEEGKGGESSENDDLPF